MKKITPLLIELTFVLTLFLTACSKETISHNPANPNGHSQNPGNQNPAQPNKPDSTYTIKVKAAITIGDLLYDSIPAGLQVISWDSNNLVHQREINLTPGANEISLPRAHTRYKLKLTKWGISDELSFTRNEIQEGTVISLGGTKAAKKLRLEESFLLAAGSYQPNAKTIYSYNGTGNVKQIDYYQKRPQHSDLKLYHSDVFEYAGNRAVKINRYNESGVKVGVTEFTYNSQAILTNIHQKSYDQETGAAIEYSHTGTNANIDIYYLFDNGNTMTYNMKFKGGNKIQDAASTSLNKVEAGVYGYDTNVNPFAHMNMPNLFLSNSSKNNLVSQQKTYSGSIPSGEPYKFEYRYDGEGYPTEMIKGYKSYITGEHLYNIKTVYTY
jgi:hypothetical protein